LTEKLKINRNKVLQDLKLNALLEITIAINNNYSTTQLLELYREILENRLGVGKLVLFHYEHKWINLLNYGMPENYQDINFENKLLDIREIETISYQEGELSKDFEIVVPVFHKEIPLAFVLLGDVNEEKHEMSKAIKHLKYVQTLTNIIVVAIENKKLYKESIQRAQITKELELAQSMQQMLFPQELPNTGMLQVSAKYMPHQQVGGDYYDFIRLNDHEFLFCMADVSGKGIAAALLMSNIQATLHSLINYTHNMKDIVNELNSRVISNTHSEKFVSIFLAKLNTKSQQFTYINAGHNPPILYYDKKFTLLDKGCPIIGITESINEIEVETFEYASEFTLLCYTDGLTDITDECNESLSVDALKEIILNHNGSNPDFINSAILEFAETYKGEREFPDDIALLTLKVKDLEF
jgi:phosphoserine phosphatase RsbU/P